MRYVNLLLACVLTACSATADISGLATGDTSTDTLAENGHDVARDVNTIKEDVRNLPDEPVVVNTWECGDVTISPETVAGMCKAEGFTRDCTFTPNDTALKLYDPTAWDDAGEQLPFNCADTITVPYTVPVTRGCAGNHTATLTITSPDYKRVTVCVYKGQGHTSHCTGPRDTTKNNFYALDHCDDGSEAGDVLPAARWVGRVDNGANKPADKFRDTAVFFDLQQSPPLS